MRKDIEAALLQPACAAGKAGPKPDAVSTIERRLSALSWQFRQRGLAFDRQDRHVATVLAGIRRTHGRPPHWPGSPAS